MINFDNINTPFYGNILDYVSEEDIYSYYLGVNINPNKLHKCCFHEDRTPSLGFYNRDGVLYYNCFGCGAHGDVFEFIKILFNLSYGESINKIREDFNVGKQHSILSGATPKIYSFGGSTISSFDSRKRTEITPIFRNFRRLDFDYWNQYHIPLDLLIKYEVTPCESVYVKNKAGELYQFAIHSNNNPIYHYNLDGSSKVYRPLNPTKKGKWLSNTNAFDIQGLKQLPKENDVTFLTSSLKDVMFLDVLGYNSVASGGEGILVPDKIMDYIFAVSKEVILFYNNDEAGIKYSKAHSKYYNIKSIMLPEEFPKDPSDLGKEYGLEYSKMLIESLL